MFKKFHWESQKLSHGMGCVALQGIMIQNSGVDWTSQQCYAAQQIFATNTAHDFLSSDKTVIWLFRWNSKVNKQISGLSCNSSFTSSWRWWIGKIYFGNHCYLKYIFVVIICAKITNNCWKLTIPRWSRCEFYTLRTHSLWRKEQKRKQTSGNISYHFGVWLYVKHKHIVCIIYKTADENEGL